MPKELDLSRVYNTFTYGHCLHFITIKPHPLRCDARSFFEKLLRYLKERKYNYWMRLVESQKGFVHIHGIWENPISKNLTQCIKLSKSTQRYINRSNAMLTDIVIDGQIGNVAKYIADNPNNIYISEAYSNSLFLKEPDV